MSTMQLENQWNQLKWNNTKNFYASLLPRTICLQQIPTLLRNSWVYKVIILCTVLLKIGTANVYIFLGANVHHPMGIREELIGEHIRLTPPARPDVFTVIATQMFRGLDSWAFGVACIERCTEKPRAYTPSVWNCCHHHQRRHRIRALSCLLFV